MRPHVEALEAPTALRSLPGRLELERLDNGLTVVLAPHRERERELLKRLSERDVRRTAMRAGASS